MTKGLEKLAKQYGVSLSELLRGKICDKCKKLLPSTAKHFSSRYSSKCKACCKEQRVGYKDEVIHHRDQNPANNSLENLQIIKTQRTHAKLHQAQGFLYAQIMYNPLVELKVL